MKVFWVTNIFLINYSFAESGELPLHESLRLDRIDFKQRFKNTIRRRNWLRGHQKLLRTLISYCSLHSALNYRLTSIQMELLLLLLEVQRATGASQFLANSLFYKFFAKNSNYKINF